MMFAFIDRCNIADQRDDNSLLSVVDRELQLTWQVKPGVAQKQNLVQKLQGHEVEM
jgi:hypothetical protein